MQKEIAKSKTKSRALEPAQPATPALPLTSPPPAEPLRVLFVASECAPYAKLGGLGDVVGALPKILRRLGVDARVIIPLYANIHRERFGIRPDGNCCVHMGGGEENWVGIHSALLEGEVPVWFVEYSRFFGRSGVYDEPWGEYTDNAFRFALLCKAAMQLCKDRQWIPDVMHVHDWPTAITCAMLKTWDRVLSPLSKTASVLTIHNVGYQGKYHAGVLKYLGIGTEHFTPDKLEDYGKINLLKAGVTFADAITTVSPTYAREILTPVGGCGLAPYLNNRVADLTGILNGVDYEVWNPETDRLIPSQYSAERLQGKNLCKEALQRRMGLAIRSDWPLFGIVTRLAWQKGISLMREALPAALDTMVFQLAVLGSGDADTENFFRYLAARYPGRVAEFIGFSNELSHWIEAGADFFLMPSLYEPCGLNQIYSLRYGTLPVVRATGGLDDTVDNYNEANGSGTGFKFWAPDAASLRNTMGWAVSTWYDRPQHVRQMRLAAMAKRFAWEDSARQYLHVYQQAMNRRRTSA